MDKVSLILIMLISAQAALNKAKTSQELETWETEAEIVCIFNDDDSACRSCLLWDDYSEQYLGLFKDGTIWSEFQEPHYWFNLLRGGEEELNVQVETRTQYFAQSFDGSNTWAYMYDEGLKQWFVRGVIIDNENDVAAVSWYTKPAAEIPDLAWEASGLDKEEHVNVIAATPAPSYCAPGCADFFIGDSYCDQACQNEDCNNDGSDCETNADDDSLPEGYCAEGCPDYWIGDSWCDAACETEECDYDGGDCGHDEEEEEEGDDEEDEEGDDDEDAQVEPEEECAPGCPDYYIGDNWCDPACQNDSCQNDAGDCGNLFLEKSARMSAHSLLSHQLKDSFIQKHEVALS